MTVLRPAVAGDADAVAPLIYASGPGTSDYVFGPAGEVGAVDFYKRVFASGRGQFGHQLFTCAEIEGEVLGVLASFGSDGATRRALETAAQILTAYRLGALGVARRGYESERITPAPEPGEWYIANVGVSPAARGKGVGSQLVEYAIEQARSAGHLLITLDVAVDNPGAQRLYERLGFEVIAERTSNLANEHGRVPSHRRMARTP